MNPILWLHHARPRTRWYSLPAPERERLLGEWRSVDDASVAAGAEHLGDYRVCAARATGPRCRSGASPTSTPPSPTGRPGSPPRTAPGSPSRTPWVRMLWSPSPRGPTRDRDAAAAGARGITKRYGHVTALDGADLTVHAGQVTALVGDNGAGKSTLVKVLSGTEAPDGGQVILDGATVSFSGPSERPSRRPGHRLPGPRARPRAHRRRKLLPRARAAAQRPAGTVRIRRPAGHATRGRPALRRARHHPPFTRGRRRGPSPAASGSPSPSPAPQPGPTR